MPLSPALSGPQLNVNSTPTSLGTPNLATEVTGLTGGGWVVVWQGSVVVGATTRTGIVGQVYASNGTAIGANFLISPADDFNLGHSDHATVVPLSSGGFMVIWEQDTPFGDLGNIKAQTYTSTGSTVGSVINVKSTSAGQIRPDAAQLASGQIAIVWEERGTTNSLRGQRIDSAGNPVGAEFVVSASYPGSFPSDGHDVAPLVGGGFVVTWRDSASSNLIHAQRFDASAVKVGAEILVSASGASNAAEPHVAGLTGGGFVVVWHDLDYTYAQIYNASGGTVSSSITVAVSARISDVVGLADGGFSVTFTSGSNGSGDVYLQQYDAVGFRNSNPIRINTTTINDQDMPAAARLSDGRLVTTWLDDDTSLHSSKFVQVQTVTPGTLPGPNDHTTPVAWSGLLHVNTKTAHGQGEPAVSALAGGGYVVVWTDGTYIDGNDTTGTPAGDGSGKGVRAQIYDALGQRVSSEFLVNTVTDFDQENADVAGLQNGGFVVVWHYSFEPTRGQIFNAAGARIGAEFTVEAGTNWAIEPTVTALKNGNFVVSWSYLFDEVHSQVFSPTGTKVGSEMVFSPASGITSTHNVISVALAGGAFALVWAGRVSTDIHIQLMNADGTRNGSVITANTSVSGTQSLPNVTALSNGDFVVAWYDSSAMAQRFNAFGAKVGSEINTGLGIGIYAPNLSATADGGFIVANGFSAQRFDASGADLGARFSVGGSGENDMAALPDGRMVFARTGHIFQPDEVYAQIYDPRPQNKTATGGNDILVGDSRANLLTALQGNDTIFGLDGDDTLNGGTGTDSVSGGNDNDVLIATHDDGNDTIAGDNGFDILDFSAVNGVVQINQLAGTVTGSAGSDTLLDVIEQVRGTNFDDVLSGGHGINVLDGEGGADQFFGNNGDDLMRGGDGNDTFYFSANDGNDSLHGGNGFDVLDYSTLDGVVQVNQLAGTTTGTANNDTLQDVFEMVIGTNFGDVLSGGHGINSLKGNGGSDQIFANNGDDYTSGGDGNDTITMGEGNDTHDFRNGEDVDTILDFTAGGTADTITLKFYTGLGITTFGQLQASGRLSTVSGHAELSLNGGDRIIFQNVASHTLLTAADFILV